jgi:hypothetical protein
VRGRRALGVLRGGGEARRCELDGGGDNGKGSQTLIFIEGEITGGVRSGPRGLP